jgi:hypothetical protein
MYALYSIKAYCNFLQCKFVDVGRNGEEGRVPGIYAVPSKTSQVRLPQRMPTKKAKKKIKY